MWHEAPVALYDVAVTGLLLWPELFTTEPCTIDVCLDKRAIGRTLVAPKVSGTNRLLTRVDVDTFLNNIKTVMTR